MAKTRTKKGPSLTPENRIYLCSSCLGELYQRLDELLRTELRSILGAGGSLYQMGLTGTQLPCCDTCVTSRPATTILNRTSFTRLMRRGMDLHDWSFCSVRKKKAN